MDRFQITIHEVYEEDVVHEWAGIPYLKMHDVPQHVKDSVQKVVNDFDGAICPVCRVSTIGWYLDDGAEGRMRQKFVGFFVVDYVDAAFPVCEDCAARVVQIPANGRYNTVRVND